MEKFARRCDATGKGINEGYVVGDGELYFASKDDLLSHLRELDLEDCNGNLSTDCKTDEDLLEFFYNDEYYYYTEWEEIDEGEWYGSLTVYTFAMTNFKTSHMIKLSNKETLMVSGRQFVLTGDYKVIGNVTDSTIAVQCPMSNQVFIIKP